MSGRGRGEYGTTALCTGSARTVPLTLRGSDSHSAMRTCTVGFIGKCPEGLVEAMPIAGMGRIKVITVDYREAPGILLRHSVWLSIANDAVR
jgi:hypothetical protein